MLAKNVRKKKRSEDIPVNSFADIAFLLIIYFILVTSLTQSMGFTSEIPAGKKSQEKQEKTATIKINNNVIYFNDKEMTLEGVGKKLKSLKLKAPGKADDDRMIILEAAGQVDYQNFFAVMSAINYAGGIVAILREEE